MIASALPKTRDYISYSSINTFRSCPLKYKFRYLDGLPEETVSSSLVFGSSIHSAVEYYFNQRMALEESPGLSDLLELYREYWQSNVSDSIRFNKTESAESLETLAEKMLRTFLESDLAKPEGRIIGVEEEVRGILSDHLPDLLGRIDLLSETDDSVVIQDFKTARSVWDQDQADQSSEQLILYGELVRRFLPRKKLKLRFAILTKTQTPKVQQLESSFDESRLEHTKHAFENVWSAIQAGHFYPNPSPMNCSGCGFRSACSAWRG